MILRTHLSASLFDMLRKTPALVRCVLGSAILLSWAAASQATGTGYLFVSSEKDHSITVLAGESYEVVKRIRTAARPRHLQFSPDRSRLYAACGEGNAIDIIDVASLTLVDRIEGIDDPEAFEFSPDGKTMYISLEDDAKLGILDLDAYFRAREEKPDLTVAEVSEDDEAMEGDDDDDEEGEEEGDEGDEEGESVAGMTTVDVGEEPEGILVSPDGKTVFVTSEVANMVHVVDTATGALRANIVAGTRPRRFALMPDGKTLWVTNELSGSVSVIDLETNKVIDTISFEPQGFRPEDVTPVGITTTADGATAYVALGRANHIAVVDVASKRIEDYILVGTRAWNTILNRDESRLFVANGLSDDISIIDTASHRVLRSVPVGRVPYAVLIDD
eukprot:XP_011406671.1 PREDICTED: uncharacterized protein LOC105314284 [Amphimedon queenslandica]